MSWPAEVEAEYAAWRKRHVDPAASAWEHLYGTTPDDQS